jgi:hypothetical protein
MTIYILDENTAECAQMLDDESLKAMIKSIARVLCNVHYAQPCPESPTPTLVYIKNKFNIPLSLKYDEFQRRWSQWASECKANYLYLVNLLEALITEHGFRYDADTDDKPNTNQYKFFDTYNKIYLWARDNVPDLPIFYGIKDRDKANKHVPHLLQKCGVYDTPCGTPFPLAIPKKYQIGLIYKDNDVTIASYRNYYQAKLISNIAKHAKKLLKDGWDIRLINQGYDVCDPQLKWTRREIPDWIKI